MNYNRVVVFGGREFTNAKFIFEHLNRLHKKFGFDVVIEGDARGADRIAGFWARKKKLTNLKFPIKKIDWDTHGKKAGYLRNQRMIDEGKPDFGVEFPGGKGTAMMRGLMKDAGLPIYRPIIPPEESK
jgi:hypothetical protein